MGLDQAVGLLKTAMPVVGMVPLIGEQLKSMVEVATQICELAQVCLHHLQLMTDNVIRHIVLPRMSI
jgi:hypothetical protein